MSPFNNLIDIKVSEEIAASTFRKKYRYLRKISDYLKMIVLQWVCVWVKEPAEFVSRAWAKGSSSQKLINIRQSLFKPYKHIQEWRYSSTPHHWHCVRLAIKFTARPYYPWFTAPDIFSLAGYEKRRNFLDSLLFSSLLRIEPRPFAPRILNLGTVPNELSRFTPKQNCEVKCTKRYISSKHIFYSSV